MTKDEVISMKSEHGATLIALIIITVILLIIAGIAIHLAVKSVNEDIDEPTRSISSEIENSKVNENVRAVEKVDVVN